MSGTQPAGYLMVTNASAGSARWDRVEVARDRLETFATVEVVTTDGSADLDGVLNRLEGRVLVVVGGDGSVHQAVARLRTRGVLADTTVGVIPLGTGNDLARGVGLPLRPDAAADVIGAGQVRHLDLVVDDTGGVAVNAVHAGLGAEAARHAAGIKPRLGSLAYPVGSLLAAVQEDGWQLEVRADGYPLDRGRRALMVAISNGPTIGGGTPLCPPAHPDDGWADVVVVAAVGAAARAGFARALRESAHLARADVFHRRARHVTVVGEPVRFNADGEVSAPVTRRQFRVEPAAWRLLSRPDT